MKTSRYTYKMSKAEADKYVGLAISIGKPKWKMNYEMVEFGLLAPWGIMNKYEEENEYREHYIKRLERIGIGRIKNNIERIQKRYPDKEILFLCWEDLNKSFCHRRMFAEWYESKTGIKIPELESPKIKNIQLSLLSL